MLQRRQKWNKDNRDLKVGDLVLVVNDQTHRNAWPLARVLEVFEGGDNHVRSVKVKTAAGTYVRPVQKLCLLEGVDEYN